MPVTPATITKRLTRFRSLSGHHFFSRHLHRALWSTLYDADQAVVLCLAERAALGQLHRVAFLSFVLLIVSVEHGAALQIFAVLGMTGLVIDHDLHRLVAFIRCHDPDDRPQKSTLGLISCLGVRHIQTHGCEPSGASLSRLISSVLPARAD